MLPTFPVETLHHNKLASSVNADEVTVIISPSGKPSEFATSLRKQSVDALRRRVHYLTAHIGFFESNAKPWVNLELTRPGANKFEERWVTNEWAKQLQSAFAARKLVIYFEKGCATAELTRAEDLITLFATPLYDGMKWEQVRMLAEDKAGLLAGDTDYESRFAHQLEYRRWVNENPDSLTSIEIGTRLSEFAKLHSCEFQTLDESMLRDQGMNLLLAVGQGAKKSPSRLHIVGHNLTPGSKPLALVGKGITFDTGGINLKPHESFVNCMKNDMGGAALFAQLFMGLVKAGYDKPLLLVIPCCENAIDANSMKPGVVITARSGKSVIIEHTDAEGRLILADAMSYVWDHYQPRQMFTAATLTTASLRQFGNYFTPVHFADEGFQSKLTDAGNRCGELFTFWNDFLPFLQGNKSNAADLTNMGRLASHASMGGGSNVAAHFLREFASGPYTHLDIFNTIWNWSGDYPGAHYGTTGSVFNSLWHTFR